MIDTKTMKRLEELHAKLEDINVDLFALESDVKWADGVCRPQSKAEHVDVRGWDDALGDIDNILGTLINELDDEMAGL